MSTRQLLGFIGAALLFLGALLPFVHTPLTGPIAYIRVESAGAVIVMALSVLSCLFTASEAYWVLAPVGLVSIGTLAFSCLRLNSALGWVGYEGVFSAGSRAIQGLSGAPDHEISFAWGWYVLVLGVVLIIASGIKHGD